jgi:type IV pilus assembly protein PilB
MSSRLGELLVREKLISLQQLRQAQDEQRKSNTRLGPALARLGFLKDGDITNFLSTQYRVPSIDLTTVEIDPELGKLVPREVCERHTIIPVMRVSSSITVAMADPTNLNAIDDIKFLTGYNVDVVVASETAIVGAIERLYSTTADYEDVLADFDEGEIDFSMSDEDVNVLELEQEAQGAPVVRLVNAILLNAINKGASDIHVEPYEKSLRVRYRVDGVLIPEMQPPLKLKNPLSSRLKIMASLDIAERRLPQDGRIKLKLGKGREGLPRFGPAGAVWREDRPALARQVEPAARHDQARLRPEAAR